MGWTHKRKPQHMTRHAARVGGAQRFLWLERVVSMLMVIFLLHLHFVTITFPARPQCQKKLKLCLHHFNASYYKRLHDCRQVLDSFVLGLVYASINKTKNNICFCIERQLWLLKLFISKLQLVSKLLKGFIRHAISLFYFEDFFCVVKQLSKCNILSKFLLSQTFLIFLRACFFFKWNIFCYIYESNYSWYFIFHADKCLKTEFPKLYGKIYIFPIDCCHIQLVK